MQPTTYHALYLSPHLDDVALSCGGQIYQQTTAGHDVLIVTLAAGWPDSNVLSEFAAFLHHAWGLSSSGKPPAEAVREVVQARRAEDARACQRLGAGFQHWNLPDCIYRRHPQSGQPLYTSDEAIFGPVDPAEAPLVHQLAGYLRGLPPAGRVVAPLTLGNHVDHQLTRQAAELAFGHELYYYEDYPYVQRRPEALAELLGNDEAWRNQEIPLDSAALQARIAAVATYQSQLPTLFGDAAQMEQLLTTQVQTTGGERLWHRVQG
jgi:LmbE family N-acetylglucosaminyl deacetylase